MGEKILVKKIKFRVCTECEERKLDTSFRLSTVHGTTFKSGFMLRKRVPICRMCENMIQKDDILKMTLIEKMEKATKIRYKDLTEIYTACFEVIKEEMLEGNEVLIDGFGTFKTRPTLRRIQHILYDLPLPMVPEFKFKRIMKNTIMKVPDELKYTHIPKKNRKKTDGENSI